MSIQLKKGTLELCVLSLLSKRDMYGFELAGRISSEIKVAEGTIYPLLKRIKDGGYVTTYLRESNAGAPRKYYNITAFGCQALDSLLEQWRELVDGVGRIVADGENQRRNENAEA